MNSSETEPPVVAESSRSASHHEWYSQLWELHAGAVWAYAARRVGPDAAPDVVANTFLVAWRRGIRPDRDLPWLYGIARNVIRDDRRAAQRQDQLAQRLTLHTTDDHSAQGDPLGPAVAREALAALDPEDREVLLLLAWEGLSGREAAAALGITHATYRMRLTRARRRLERAMEQRATPDRSSGEEASS